MLWIVDGNFWLLLLLPLLLQPPFGTSRQFLIVVGNTKRPAFRIWNGHFVSDGAGLFGALAPIFRFIDRDFCHLVCSSILSWLRPPSLWMSRHVLIVVGNTKRPAFRIWNGHFVSDGAGLFGALAPIFRFIDRDFGH